MKNLRGRVALLTGGSRGLGAYVAEALAGEGVNLALTARSEAGLASTAKKLRRFDVDVRIYPADITDSASRADLLAQVRADFGPIDLLINNAGIEWVSSYTAIPPDHIEKMLQTNLMAPMLLTRLALPDMLARGTGHIVTMSSLGGKKGSPYSATYAATKAGLIQWISGLRAELYKTGVSASVICPGFVAESGMFAVYNKRAPRITGETTPSKVARAVIRAIKKDVGEIVVNSKAMWPLIMMEAIHPDLSGWVLRTFGVHDFYRRQAKENEAKGL